MSHSRHVDDIRVELEGSLSIHICFMLKKERKENRKRDGIIVPMNNSIEVVRNGGGRIVEMEDILSYFGGGCF